MLRQNEFRVVDDVQFRKRPVSVAKKHSRLFTFWAFGGHLRKLTDAGVSDLQGSPSLPVTASCPQVRQESGIEGVADQRIRHELSLGKAAKKQSMQFAI